MESSRLSCAVIGALALVTPALLMADTNDGEDVVSIKKTLEARYPKITIVDVRPSPIPSLYEVFTGTAIMYSAKAGDYLISGSLIDTRSKANLTQARVHERNAVDFSTLPLDLAIKVVKGSGARKMAVFTDPDCPFCRRLEEELKSVNDVTMYVFLFPLTAIHPNAERRAKAIWCSDDRAQAWSQWMLEKKDPVAASCSADPVADLLELGKKLNVSGTPTLYFENGSRASGAMKAADLEARLTQATKASLPVTAR